MLAITNHDSVKRDGKMVIVSCYIACINAVVQVTDQC